MRKENKGLIKISIFLIVFVLFLFIIIADICGFHILSTLTPTKIILYFLISLWICGKAFMYAYKRKDK